MDGENATNAKGETSLLEKLEADRKRKITPIKIKKLAMKKQKLEKKEKPKTPRKKKEKKVESMDRQSRNRNESRVAKLIESLETCDRISYGKESSERKSSDLEKDRY